MSEAEAPHPLAPRSGCPTSRKWRLACRANEAARLSADNYRASGLADAVAVSFEPSSTQETESPPRRLQSSPAMPTSRWIANSFGNWRYRVRRRANDEPRLRFRIGAAEAGALAHEIVRRPVLSTAGNGHALSRRGGLFLFGERVSHFQRESG